VRGLVISIDVSGIGCASFDSVDHLDTPLATIVASIECELDEAIEVLGVRHLDGDGREVDQPVAHGVTLIGFRRSTALGES
jgi:hypothetical protein